MFKTGILLAVLFVTINIFAHEGHENAPGTLKANHGGIVKTGKEINLEYQVSGSEVKLFPLSHEGNDISSSEIKLTATTKIPKGKAIDAKLETKDGIYVARIDFKDAYRVEMNIIADLNGKKSSFKIQIEK